jgi:hypothetical protein
MLVTIELGEERVVRDVPSGLLGKLKCGECVVLLEETWGRSLARPAPLEKRPRLEGEQKPAQQQQGDGIPSATS